MHRLKYSRHIDIKNIQKSNANIEHSVCTQAIFFAHRYAFKRFLLFFFFLNHNRTTETGIVRSLKFAIYFSKNKILLYKFSPFSYHSHSNADDSYMIIIYMTYRLRAKERKRNEIETGSIWNVQNLYFIKDL